jgi:hypothetical protein
MDLRPMTRSEFEQYVARSVPEYAASKVQAGIRSADEAERLASEEIERLVPDGLATPGQVLFAAVDEGVAVGILSLALPAGGRPQRSVCDIEVDEVHRGKGHGRAIIAPPSGSSPRAGCTSSGSRLRLHHVGDQAVREPRVRGRGTADGQDLLSC